MSDRLVVAKESLAIIDVFTFLLFNSANVVFVLLLLLLLLFLEGDICVSFKISS
jgi:hypothetical protein